MDSEKCSKFAMDFPAELLHTAISLKAIGRDEKAWKYKDAITAVHFYAEHNYAILGGDVYGKDGEAIFSMSSPWSFDQNEAKWKDLVEHSARQALMELQDYHRIYGEEYYYGLIAQNEGESAIRNLLPGDFPEELIQTAMPTKSPMITGIAWKYEDAIKATNYYAEHNYAILGGDVYVYSGEYGEFVHTYDNWYLNRDNLAWEEYVKASAERTITYLDNYVKRNGDVYYYGFVVSSAGHKARTGK